MLKWLIGLGVVVAVLLGTAFLFKDQIGRAAMASQLKPSGAFDATDVPPAPDYSQISAWAALPEIDDNADFTPQGLSEDQLAAAAAVFFVHPTTYISKDSWVAPIDAPEAAAYMENFVLRGQASSFNDCCAVFAPRYRQATFWSFIDETGSGEAARDFAYQDVARAFDVFLERIGDAPFVVAGHSQGGEHVARLLKERISATPLVDRLVAAYPVGWPVIAEDMTASAPDIPLCSAPDETGCYATWNSLGPKARLWGDMADAACVNPLSWTTDGAPAAASINPGSLSLTEEVRYEPGVTGAQCTDRLLVGSFQNDMFADVQMNLGPDNFHVLDYALFYGAIRENATRRVTAHLED